MLSIKRARLLILERRALQVGCREPGCWFLRSSEDCLYTTRQRRIYIANRWLVPERLTSCMTCFPLGPGRPEGCLS
jgi:hypothetical protein